MKIKALTVLLALLAGMLFPQLSAVSHAVGEKAEAASASVSEAITVGQMADFLLTKKAHYPFSDQFMERYQQTSGGYLDNAKRAGIPVDRQQHSPDQKWHFFESWYYPSIEEGTLSRDDDAKKRIYTNLLCPELLLWIYEACGVEPAKVRAAMKAAEAGKVSGASVSTIAKNMRSCVSWDDLAKAFAEKVTAEGVSVDKTTLEIKVGETATVIASATPINTTDSAKWSVTEGADVISITEKANQVIVKGLKEGTARLKVSYNENAYAECAVTVIQGEPTPPPITEDGKYVYNITYDLGTRVTAKAIETAEGAFAVFTLDGTGQSIIQSVGDITYLYGGGHGGSGDNKWYSGDMLKFGTTSVNGSITLKLSGNVNYVRITGYVYDDSCKLQVGDTEFVCSDMNIVGKATVEGGEASTVLITFTETNILTISTLNKKPLFITSIEIGYDGTLTN